MRNSSASRAQLAQAISGLSFNELVLVGAELGTAVIKERGFPIAGFEMAKFLADWADAEIDSAKAKV